MKRTNYLLLLFLTATGMAKNCFAENVTQKIKSECNNVLSYSTKVGVGVALTVGALGSLYYLLSGDRASSTEDSDNVTQNNLGFTTGACLTCAGAASLYVVYQTHKLLAHCSQLSEGICRKFHLK